MIDGIKFLEPYKKRLSNLREDLKKDVQQLIDEKKINYEQAIRIFEDSKLFEIEGFIMTNGIFDVYTDYISGSWINRCETIYFSQISDWINEGYVDEDDDEDFLKAYKDKNITKEDLQKEIYDTIISDNIVGFIYDW
jgi:hypothetical protein